MLLNEKTFSTEKTREPNRAFIKSKNYLSKNSFVGKERFIPQVEIELISELTVKVKI